MSSALGRDTNGYGPAKGPLSSERARRREEIEREIARLLIGESSAMRELRAMIARFGPTPLPALIQGPTGSGKELVARALHLASERTGNFVAFNVCAVAETMFEDALFGHVKGAFTGATGDSAGYLAEANGGSVFLDEISGLSMMAQAKLLRAIETGVFRPVGAARDRCSQFRVIAASNEDLVQLAALGRFRRDLLQRLGGVTLRVSPLYQRPQDVQLLARHFAMEWQGTTGRGISRGAVDALEKQDWVGNVRALKHVVERAMVLAVGAEIRAEHVSAALATEPGSPNRGRPEVFERERLVKLLDDAGGNTAHVALTLGVNRATVYRRMRRYGIETSQVRLTLSTQ
jgi:DNA-binding NtrC family response regulator